MKKVHAIFFSMLAVLLFGGAGCFGQDKPQYTGPGGMYISEDKGENWKAINNFPTADGTKNLQAVSVFALQQDPLDTEALYWQSKEHGLFYSYDAGATWQRPASVFQTGKIYSVAVHPKDKCTIYATDGQKILRTSDCSRHWEELYTHIITEEIIRSLDINPFNSDELSFITDLHMYRSTDRGVSWERIQRYSQGGLVELQYDPLNQNVIYLARKTRGLLRSTDNGIVFDILDKPMKGFEDAKTFRRLYIHPTKANTIFWISKHGIMRSDDRGDSWTAYNLVTPPGIAQIYGFAINPKNDQEIYYTGTVNNKSSLYKSVDGGKKWITKKLPSGQVPTHLHIHPEKSNILYLGFTIIKE
ncbi:MAG: hypothetical protein V1848_00825 [Candidatus Magasanikbacteria bacterium]